MAGVQSVGTVLIDVFELLCPQALECPSVNSPTLKTCSDAPKLIEFLEN
jgi:hypothetical protein